MKSAPAPRLAAPYRCVVIALIIATSNSANPASQDGTNVVAAGDCVRIQAAIRELPAGGGEVVLGAGKFTCRAPVVIDRDNITLRGQGAATILVLADGANSPVINVGETATPPATVTRHVRIAHLAIDGNRRKQPTECWGGVCDTGGKTFIRNNGINVRAAEDVVVEDVFITRARSGGLVSERGVRRMAVRRLTASDNYFDGVAGVLTEQSKFEHLKLVNNCSAGLSFDDGFNHNVFENVTISRDSAINCEAPLVPGQVAVFMRKSAGNIFRGFRIDNAREHGIFLAQVNEERNTPAMGNRFSGGVIAGAGGAGIRVNDESCIDNSFEDIQLAGNQGGCLSEARPGLTAQSAVVCR